MFTRVTLGAEGGMANADHLIGALALTVVSISAAEVTRAARYLLAPLGGALLVTPFVYDADLIATIAGMACGLGLILLCARRGGIKHRYAGWQKLIV